MVLSPSFDLRVFLQYLGIFQLDHASLQHHDLQMSGAQYGAEIDYWTILMVYCVLFIYMSRLGDTTLQNQGDKISSLATEI